MSSSSALLILANDHFPHPRPLLNCRTFFELGIRAVCVAILFPIDSTLPGFVSSASFATPPPPPFFIGITVACEARRRNRRHPQQQLDAGPCVACSAKAGLHYYFCKSEILQEVPDSLILGPDGLPIAEGEN